MGVENRSSIEIQSRISKSPPPLHLYPQSTSYDRRIITSHSLKPYDMTTELEPIAFYTVDGARINLPQQKQIQDPGKPKRTKLRKKDYPRSKSWESMGSSLYKATSTSRASVGTKGNNFLLDSKSLHATRSREYSEMEREKRFYHHFHKYYLHTNPYWVPSRNSNSYLSSIYTERPWSLPSVYETSILSNTCHVQEGLLRYSSDELTSCPSLTRGLQTPYSEWSLFADNEVVNFENETKAPERQKSCSPAFNVSANVKGQDKCSYGCNRPRSNCQPECTE
nr:PREDICTED: uncharacterized protein LOC102363018 [Latimeria chalumnae]|eukprot:XP_014341274.1 PREDICTED: uncharacterized protein LOC102363018 [Latimeria chalumnae]